MRERLAFVVDVFIGSIGWVSFGAMWWIAFDDGRSGLPIAVAWYAVLFVIAVITLNLVWIRHNVAQSHRFNRRVSGPRVARDYSHDSLGREIQGDPTALRAARAISIDLVIDAEGREHKVYGAVSEYPTETEVEACSASLL